jgi:hypothetical protein
MKNNWLIIGISACLSSLYLFYGNNSLLSFASILIFILLYIVEYIKYPNSGFILIKLLILSLPFSYYPVIGNEYISLFILMQISLIFTSGTKKLKKKAITFILLWLSIFIFTLFLMHQIFYNSYAMECIIKIMIFLLPLLIASCSINISKEQINYLIKLFVLTGIISGLMVIIQYCFYISSIIIDLGHQTEFSQRIAFAGLFYDYSIMSVYMSAISGILFIGIFLHKYVFNRIIDFLLIIFFICTSAITSARTGIIAFLIVLFLFLLLEKKKSNIVLFLILSVPLFYLGFHILSLNRNTVLLDDSGRWNTYLLAFDFFTKNPIWGSGGLGYVAMTNNMGPHNFILDFLVDFGLIVTIFLLILFGTLFYNGLKIHPILSYLLLLFLVGGLFHASLINSHYIMIPLILIVSYKSSS